MSFTISDAEARLLILEIPHCQSPELASLLDRLRAYFQTQSTEHQVSSTWPDYPVLHEQDSDFDNFFNTGLNETTGFFGPSDSPVSTAGDIISMYQTEDVFQLQRSYANEETLTVNPALIHDDNSHYSLSVPNDGSVDGHERPISEHGCHPQTDANHEDAGNHLRIRGGGTTGAHSASRGRDGVNSESSGGRRKTRRRYDVGVGGGGGGDIPVANWVCNRGGVHPGLGGGGGGGRNNDDGNDDDDDDDNDPSNNFDDEWASLSPLAPDPLNLAGDEGEGEEEQVRHEIPEPETQKLSKAAYRFLMSLVNASDRILEGKEDTGKFGNAISVLEALEHDDSLWRIQAAYKDDSLATVANRCIEATQATAYTQFILSLHLIHYRTKIECEHLVTRQPREVIESYLKVDREPETLAQWRKLGASYCSFAGAGSLYLLAILATASAKTKFGRLAAGQIRRLAAAIRAPNPNTSYGRFIISSIVPAISKLRSLHNFKFCTMFAKRYFVLHAQPEFIIAADMRSSDKFFDSIAFNDFVKPRDWTIWAACNDNALTSCTPTAVLFQCKSYSAPMSHLSSLSYSDSFQLSSPTAVNSSPTATSSSPIALRPNSGPANDEDCQTSIKINIINTNYNPTSKKNKSSKLPPSGASLEEESICNEKQRDLAEDAYVPTDFKDLERKLKDQLKTGVRRGGYIKITHEILDGKILRINDRNGNIICIIDPTMPDSIRSTLLDRLLLLFPDQFLNTDTKSEDVFHRFFSYHHVNYNRYSVLGIDSDPSQEPATYSRNGRSYNTGTMVPRASAEQNLMPDLHDVFIETFRDLFGWKSDQLKILLPNIYEKLARYANRLPGDEFSPAYPFGGFVVNLNVSTKIHRDSKDMDICSVIPISRCEGGGLGLLEAGVLLDLLTGDSIDFKSGEQTHFNCHFVGRRASLVLHTDSAAAAWTDGTNTLPPRNGWANNKFFRSSSPYHHIPVSLPPSSRKCPREPSSDSDTDY